jgi:hypothetical protein
MKVVIAACLLVVMPCVAQRLTVYSPLSRFDPFGQLVAADRGTAKPRDILSPGVPRNAYSGLRLVVELSTPETYEIEVGLNPHDAVDLTMYREVFTRTDSGWLPDRLEKVPLPYRGSAQDFVIPGQTAVTFWLDLWVPRDAPVDRIKVQPQLWSASIDSWILYPMEVRIQEPVVMDRKPAFSTLPPLGVRSDAYVRGPLNALLCGKPEVTKSAPATLTVGDLIRREAEIAMSLVRKRDINTLAMGWCASQDRPPEAGPEWFLRFRDHIYRAAGATD